MREFRGNRKDNGEWVEGYYFKSWEDAYILWGTTNGNPNMIEVLPETVGQFTGLLDQNGKDLDWWNDDILQSSQGITGCVAYSKTCAEWTVVIKQQRWCSLAAAMADGWEKRGNKWDNPDLLEEATQ